MDLVSYLAEVITKQRNELKIQSAGMRKSEKALKTFDPADSEYLVELYSLWANEGEKNTRTSYSGKLPDAIRNAEEKFMKENRRKDSRLQAKYNVTIKVGSTYFPVPEQFWNEYIRGNPKPSIPSDNS